MMGIRINKYLSQFGFTSRREADKLILDGRVTVNNKIIQPGYKVQENEIVKVDGEKIKSNFKKNIYMAFNKPKGIVCTTDTEKEENNIIDYINYNKRIFPIGRLDKLSEGLILLTNDGEIVNKILRSRYKHEKEYLVTVNKKISKDFLKKLENGVPILNTTTRKCETTFINDFQFKIILTQGLNRQIRRMCEYFDFRVKKLERIRIINIELDVPLGKWRYLSQEEIKFLKNL
ncbi:MAG: 23S rRNA pseudouridine synthase F [Flavobacteriaceae bacterium]|nr:23S rRNA pseudouridine synthase F [Flavobacteriaceae bacterium]